jgi:transposase InsO family protein
VYYFTKWAEAMPIVKFDDETTTIFVFNQIIAQFGIQKDIFTDHGSHFQNEMMVDLASKMGFKQDHASPYYPQENRHVEVMNKSLKSIFQKMDRQSKSNWHVILYLSLWTYQTIVNTSTDLSLFLSVHRVKSLHPIEFEIPSLKLAFRLLPETYDLE